MATHDEILLESLTLAEHLTHLGVDLPEQSTTALAVRDALTGVIHGDDPATSLAAEVQAGTIAPEDARTRALAALDDLARREHVSRLAVAMVLAHSRAIRRPIVAAHDNILDQLRPRFSAAAKALAKARAVPVDATAEQAVDLDTARLDLWREIPTYSGQLSGIAQAVIQLASLDDRTRHVPPFAWFVADSDGSAQAADLYAETGGRGDPWHHLVIAGHGLRLATVDEAVSNAERHAERMAERQARLDQQLATTRRTPLEQSRIDRDVELLRAIR